MPYCCAMRTSLTSARLAPAASKNSVAAATMTAAGRAYRRMAALAIISPPYGSGSPAILHEEGGAGDQQQHQQNAAELHRIDAVVKAKSEHGAEGDGRQRREEELHLADADSAGQRQ